MKSAQAYQRHQRRAEKRSKKEAAEKAQPGAAKSAKSAHQRGGDGSGESEMTAWRPMTGLQPAMAKMVWRRQPSALTMPIEKQCNRRMLCNAAKEAYIIGGGIRKRGENGGWRRISGGSWPGWRREISASAIWLYSSRIWRKSGNVKSQRRNEIGGEGAA
jgi:hypothetical protein